MDWGERAKEIKDKIIDAIWYFCFNVSGDDPVDCITSHIGIDLYELASLYQGSWYSITERDLSDLERMPDEVYDSLSAELEQDLEDLVDELLSSGEPEEE